MRSLLILVTSAGLAALVIFFTVREKSAGGTPPANPVVASAKRASDSRVRETLAALAAINPPEHVADRQLDGIPLATRQRLGVAFDALTKSRYSVHRDEEREAILERVAADESAATAASRYASDLSLVKSHFGDKQAEARMFSIQLLKHRAKQGHPEALWETTKVLGKKMGESSPRNAGQERDLEDLILASVEVEGDKALGDLDKIVDRLGYQPNLKKPFVAGIYFALQSRYPKDEIVSRLEQIGISPKEK